MMKFRFFLVGLVTTLVMVLGLQACKDPYTWHANNITGMMPDLRFTLIGPDENKVDAKSLQGKPVLVFFGFTHCPDVCPTTLAQLKVVINKLGEDADGIQTLLVSVDPGRDTPAVMKAYTAGFGSWLVGLTGPKEDIDALRERYGVYASMESSDHEGDHSDHQLDHAGDQGKYNVMHTTVVFAFDKKGKARLLFTDVSDSDAVVSDIRQLLN